MVCNLVTKEAQEIIKAGRKKWRETSEEYKQGWWTALSTEIAGFIQWWDTLKEIDRKLPVDIWDIARKTRWEWSFNLGKKMGQDYKDHDLKDLYHGYIETFEGTCDMEFTEFNDEAIAWRVHKCPCHQIFKESGKTDEEIKELADLYCLMDIGCMSGFNPNFEVFHQPRLLMKGDPYCTYRIEYKEKNK